MLLLGLGFLLACAPAALLLAYLARSHKGDLKWQLKLAGICAGGIIALLPAALIARWLEGMGPQSDIWNSFAVTALPEESGKLIAIIAATRFLKLNRLEALEAGLCLSVGFAVFENFMYVGANLMVFAARSISAAPLHAACGYLIASSTSSHTGRSLKGATGVASAIALHGGYNLSIAAGPLGAAGASVAAIGTLALCLRALGRERVKFRLSPEPSPSP